MSEYAPSQNKLKKARQEGKTVKSPLLTQIVVLFGTVSIVWVMVSNGWVRVKMLLEYTLGPGLEQPLQVARLWGELGLFAVVILLLLSLFLGVLAEAAQVGLQISFIPVQPKFEKCFGTDGIKRLGSTFKEGWEIALRLLLAGVLIWLFYQRVSLELAEALSVGFDFSINWIRSQLIWAAFAAGTLLLVITALEYQLKRLRFNKQMRMKREELMREHKEDEGDPHIKSHRKALHQALIHQELVRRVRGSKMIVVKR